MVLSYVDYLNSLMETLPTEIQLFILDQLDGLKSRKFASLVCKLWYELIVHSRINYINRCDKNSIKYKITKISLYLHKSKNITKPLTFNSASPYNVFYNLHNDLHEYKRSNNSYPGLIVKLYPNPIICHCCNAIHTSYVDQATYIFKSTIENDKYILYESDEINFQATDLYLQIIDIHNNNLLNPMYRLIIGDSHRTRIHKHIITNKELYVNKNNPPTMTPKHPAIIPFQIRCLATPIEARLARSQTLETNQIKCQIDPIKWYSYSDLMPCDMPGGF